MNKLTRLGLVAVCGLCLVISVFLIFNPARVFAACSATQTCTNGPGLFCAGDNNCNGSNSGGGSVRLQATPVTVVVGRNGVVDKSWTGLWQAAELKAASEYFSIDFSS
jgi:hypothetical protein